MRKKKFYPYLAICAFLLFSAAAGISADYSPFYVGLGLSREISSEPVEYMGAVSFGMRRFFSDLAFIRLMQYYGTEKIPAGAKKIEHREPNGHVHYHYEGEPEFGAGEYPLFYRMTRDIIVLDPYFKEAVIYSAGSLAFNLNKPDAAVAVLKTALAYSPRQWQYLTLLGAIAESKSKDKTKLAEFMYTIAMEKDTPVMIKQISAFLNKKAGRLDRAARIYEFMLKTTRDESYLDKARRNLRDLGRLK